MRLPVLLCCFIGNSRGGRSFSVSGRWFASGGGRKPPGFPVSKPSAVHGPLRHWELAEFPGHTPPKGEASVGQECRFLAKTHSFQRVSVRDKYWWTKIIPFRLMNMHKRIFHWQIKLYSLTKTIFVWYYHSVIQSVQEDTAFQVQAQAYFLWLERAVRLTNVMKL